MQYGIKFVNIDFLICSQYWLLRAKQTTNKNKIKQHTQARDVRRELFKPSLHGPIFNIGQSRSTSLQITRYNATRQKGG